MNAPPCSRSRCCPQTRSCSRSLAAMCLCDLAALLAPWLSLDVPYPAAVRERLYTPLRTFWLFLSQMLSADGSCREAVRKALAWLAASEAGETSPSTSGFCQARLRLKEAWLTPISQHLSTRVESTTPREWRWRGHDVKVIDGSSVSMPDTPSNQACWPQPKGQRPGCGFPVARIVGVFSLATGVLLALRTASLHVNERVLVRSLFDSVFRPGDVALADRGFCGFAAFHELLGRGVDSVMRRHARLKHGAGLRTIRRLGRHDLLMEWRRWDVPSIGYDRPAWEALPDRMQVREITVHVRAAGFRTKRIVLLTTLLDPTAYPAEAFAHLYHRRWEVETDLRHLKTTLGLEVLRCKSPAMIEKELIMGQIAYNLIRALMIETARTHHVDPGRLSFKGALVTVRDWAPRMSAATHDNELDSLHRRLLACLARDLVPLRPDRREPRVYKRRPKNYARLVKPRHRYREILHRNRYTRSMRGDE